MSLIRTSRERFLRARPLCAVALLLGLGGVIGCSAEPLFRDEPINCAVEDPYDFNLTTVTFACYGDSTPDASVGSTPQPIGDAGLCGTPTAQVLTSAHNNDWGSTCNGSNFGSVAVDESAYEGVSFWARAAAGTTQGFTLSLYDANNTPINLTDPSAGGNCKVYNANPDGGIAGSTTVAVVDPATGQILTGVAVASRQPDECQNNKTNSYDYVMAVTNKWALYTIPWANFTQGAYPNRVPNSVLTETGDVPGTGLLTNKLWSISIRPPKEAPFELWIDKLSFYRKRVHDAGPDLGPDAAPDAELALDAELVLDADLVLDAELALDVGLGTELDAGLDAVPSVDVN